MEGKLVAGSVVGVGTEEFCAMDVHAPVAARERTKGSRTAELRLWRAMPKCKA
jgi:hypothetical protein